MSNKALTDIQVNKLVKELSAVSVKVTALQKETRALETKKWMLQDKINGNESRRIAESIIGKCFKDDPKFLSEKNIDGNRQTYYRVNSPVTSSKYDKNYGTISYECCQKRVDKNSAALSIREATHQARDFIKNTIEISTEEYLNFKKELVAKALA